MARPPPELIDMPVHISEKVLDKLTLYDRLRFRICSKPFKAVVDNAKQSYEKICIDGDGRGYTLTIVEKGVEHCIQYHSEGIDKCLVVVEKKELGPDNVYGPRQQIVTPISTRELQGSTAVDVLMNDVKSLFRNVHRMTINKLYLEIGQCSPSENYISKLGALLENQNGPMLHVKELWMMGNIDFMDVICVLPSLLPGHLHRLHFNSISIWTFHFNRISRTPQWNNANAVEITSNNHSLRFERDLPHIKFVTLKYSIVDIEIIRAAIAKAEELGNQFEMLRLRGSCRGMRRYIEDTFPCLCDNPRFRYKQHPNLNSFLRFTVGTGEYDFEIRRVQRINAFSFEVTDNDRRYLDM